MLYLLERFGAVLEQYSNYYFMYPTGILRDKVIFGLGHASN